MQLPRLQDHITLSFSEEDRCIFRLLFIGWGNFISNTFRLFKSASIECSEYAFYVSDKKKLRSLHLIFMINYTHNKKNRKFYSSKLKSFFIPLLTSTVYHSIHSKLSKTIVLKREHLNPFAKYKSINFLRHQLYMK